MEVIVVALVGCVAVGSWGVAFVSWILAVRNRAPGVSLKAMCFEGVRMFDSASFTAQGQRHQVRFVRAFIAFMLSIVAATSAAILFGP